jgi:hypothetical protein
MTIGLTPFWNTPRHREAFLFHDGFLAAGELIKSGALLGPVPFFFDDRPSGSRHPSHDGEKGFCEKFMVSFGWTGLCPRVVLETPQAFLAWRFFSQLNS